MNPKVSLITPCFNVAPYVERMIQSVRRQTFRDWELILVDDGSTDDTAAVIKRAIADESRARMIQQENQGVCAARNRGYGETNCAADYVYFPDSDDMLAPDLLATLVQYLEIHPEVGLVYCAYQHVDEYDRALPTPRWPRYIPTRFGVGTIPENVPVTPFVSIYCWAQIPESVAVMRRSVYERTTGWPEDFGQHGEGVILFSQFALLSEVHYVPTPLYLYRRRRGQSSGDPAKQGEAERRVVEWWRNAQWLTEQQRRVVLHAEWFRYYRLEPWKGIKAAAGYVRTGDHFKAARFLIGAVRRYLLSFLS